MNEVLLAAVAVAVGTGLGYGHGSWAVPLSSAAVGAFAGVIVVRRDVRVAFVATLVAVLLATSAAAAWRSSGASSALLPRWVKQHAVANACGTVRSVRPKSAEVDVDRVTRDRKHWRTHEPLIVAGNEVRGVREGERVCAIGSLVPPRTGHLDAPLMSIDRLEHHGTGSLLRLVGADVRRRFSDAALHALPPTQAGLLLGMTDGDTQALGPATIEAFRTTGLAHLVAVSGENVAVLLAVVVLLARTLVPRGRWLRVAVAMPPLVFFAFLTGLQPSVLRAVITAGLALAVTAGGRTVDALRVTALAFVVLVLASPDVLFNLGFQLSFAATLGLILWAGPLATRFERVLGSGKIASLFSAAAACTIAAQAAVAPLLAWHFGRVPALGGIANLIAVPLAPVVTMGGIATLGLASLIRPLDWLPATFRLPLDYILWTARTFARLPAASVGAGLLGGLAITAALVALLAHARRIRVAALAAVVASVGLTAGQTAARPSCDGPALVALDVGEGTAVLLRAGGHAVLVDGGPPTGNVVGDLDAVGVHNLDAVFLSHPHLDHLEGVIQAVQSLRVGRVVGSVILPWARGAVLERLARSRRIPVAEAAAGDRFTFGPQISLEAISPPPGAAPPDQIPESFNAYSLVLRAHVGPTTVLLTGDIGAQSEQPLIDTDVAAQILVAPHHGSADLDPAFVDAVAPRMTLVTVGPNPYGHPTGKALRIYARHGPVFRTDKNGSVTVCLAARTVRVWTQR